jgi:predicted PurR-regulated permease PerM
VLTAAALAAAWLARQVLMLGFIGVLLAAVFTFPLGWLSRLVPRSVALLVLVLVLGGLTGGVVSLAVPSLSRQLEQLEERAPRSLAAAQRWWSRVEAETDGQPAAQVSEEQPAPDPAAKRQTRELAMQVSAKALPAVLAAVGGLAEVALVVVLGLFLAYRPATYRDGLRRLVPPEHEARFDELWLRLGQGLRRWVAGILITMTLMGSLAAVGLLLAGVEDWPLLGVLTFLGTFVPYLGAIVSAVPGLLSALGQSNRVFLLALGVYTAVHLVEGYLIEPIVMRRAVDVKPALLVFGQGVFLVVLGPLGAVVATPLLVCIQIVVEHLWVERTLQEAPGTAPGEVRG